MMMMKLTKKRGVPTFSSLEKHHFPPHDYTRIFRLYMRFNLFFITQLKLFQLFFNSGRALQGPAGEDIEIEVPPGVCVRADNGIILGVLFLIVSAYNRILLDSS